MMISFRMYRPKTDYDDNTIRRMSDRPWFCCVLHLLLFFPEVSVHVIHQPEPAHPPMFVSDNYIIFVYTCCSGIVSFRVNELSSLTVVPPQPHLSCRYSPVVVVCAVNIAYSMLYVPPTCTRNLHTAVPRVIFYRLVTQ